MRSTVAALMSSPVVAVGESMTMTSCLELMRSKSIGALAVLDSHGALIGMLSEADALGHAGVVAADAMRKDIPAIGSDASLAAAARLMLRVDATHLPVLDASHRLAGIVSRGDLLRVYVRSDDSIRKEISHGLLRELPLLGRGRINVEVSGGVVRLHGEAESTALTALLLRLVAAVPGVARVENDLRAPDLAGSASNG